MRKTKCLKSSRSRIIDKVNHPCDDVYSMGEISYLLQRRDWLTDILIDALSWNTQCTKGFWPLFLQSLSSNFTMMQYRPGEKIPG
ncbi:hypothetical protein SAMN05443582_104351 [Phyllobacterium sp. OV277]|nr:hypothetical protein SAMN05443582_104351 [Phyllobacterium sp. OV277]